ncbi:MAG TPA: MFS transporter [Pseudonocardiaceae bacterium]|jgi:EmrB/QacA subfamily drug resistance transporter
MTTTAPPLVERAATDRRPALMLTVLLIGQFMAMLDITIVNVAMPTMGTDLHASGAALQLIVSGYTISYAMLLITCARLGELLGHRRLFWLGVMGFTASSLLCGLAPNSLLLIIARFIQGAAAAVMMPQIMSTIQKQFTGAARTRALSAFSAVIAVGAVAGQILGGVLVSADILGTGWRPVFLVNVPVGIVVAILVPRLMPADGRRGTRKLDLLGLAIAVPSVFLIVVPLVLGHEDGWPAWAFLCIALGLVLAAVFVMVERRVAARGGDPLLKIDVLRIPGVATGLIALSAGIIAYGGSLFTIGLHLQSGLGDSALRAGLTFAPTGVAFGLCSFYWRRLPDRVHHVLTPIGFTIAAFAYAAVAFTLDAGSGGGPVLLAELALLGFGMGIGYSPLLMNSLVHVPTRSAADASGLMTTTVQLGQVIAVATFGSLFLSLAGQPQPHASAHAVATTLDWLAGLLLVGALIAALLARTIGRARRVTG